MTRPRERPRLTAGWAVGQLDPGLRCYVLGMSALAAVLTVVLLSSTRVDGRDAFIAAALLAAAACSVEATRRVGRPSDTLVKDLLSAWWLPMAVLLPPVFVLLAPVPVLALAQWRVRATLPYRRVFSAACVGVSYAVVSMVFHADVAAVSGPWTAAGSSEGAVPWLLWAGAVAVAGAVAAALNALLVALAVKAADPQETWRGLLVDAERSRLEAVEVCVGVTVAVLMMTDPLLVVFMLGPVLMLQRGLLHGQLRAVALLDAKTGLLNAPAWEREAEAGLRTHRRNSRPSAVLLVDIDHFEAVNDVHGHLVGDLVLRAVAEVLAGAVRDGDLVGRFGGEEFVALLPDADVAQTDLVAERLRARVAALVVDVGAGQAVSVTVSIGVAVTEDSALSVLDLLAGADRCMYQAKAAGRNRVVAGGRAALL